MVLKGLDLDLSTHSGMRGLALQNPRRHIHCRILAASQQNETPVNELRR